MRVRVRVSLGGRKGTSGFGSYVIFSFILLRRYLLLLFIVILIFSSGIPFVAHSVHVVGKFDTMVLWSWTRDLRSHDIIPWLKIKDPRSVDFSSNFLFNFHSVLVGWFFFSNDLSLFGFGRYLQQREFFLMWFVAIWEWRGSRFSTSIRPPIWRGRTTIL